MELLDTLKTTLDTLSEKQFRTYVYIALGGLSLFILLMFFYYYQSSNSLTKEIIELNKRRSGEVKDILTTAERIKKQKEHIDALLAEDPDFKFLQYLDSVLAQLRLTEKKDIISQPREIEVDQRYIESVLDIKLNDINMKQLAEFLHEIENKKRVYTKRLEITKSKTTANSLEANIMIATLFPKEA